MRDLWPYLKLMKSVWLAVLGGMALGLVALLSAVGLLSLAGWFISATAFVGLVSALAATNFNYFLPSAGVRAFALLRIVSRYGERVVSHNTTFRILQSLRVWLYQKIEPLSSQWLNQQRRGDLLNRLVGDIDALDNLYLRVLSPWVLALIVTMAIWLLLHWLNAQIAVWVAGMMLMSIVVLPVLSAWLGRYHSAKLVAVQKQLRIHAIEGVSGLSELLTFHAFAKKSEAFMQVHHDLMIAQKRLSVVKGLIQALLVLFVGLSLWGAMYLGSGLVASGQLDGVYLALIALAVLAGYEAIMPLPNAFQYLGQTVAAAKRLNQVADQKASIVFPTRSKHVPQDNSVQMQAVDFAYKTGQSVLSDWHMQIQSGEHVAIVGKTGCGKSTLLQLLTRMLEPSSGEIRIGGVSITKLTEQVLRQQISVMEQQPHIFNATVRDNLRLAKVDISDSACWQVLKQVQLDQFISELPEGLGTWLGESGMRFSGGQLRRLALARILLHDAPIWILDEPTEGLDYTTERQVVESVLAAAKDKTVMWISHKRLGLEKLDRVIMLTETKPDKSGG